MAVSNLTIERLRHALDYNPDTGVFTNRIFRRPKSLPGQVASSGVRRGYLKIKLDGATYVAHRLAWFYVHGEWPSGQIDHINHDRADNRICNLRVVDGSTNAKNRAKESSNSSGRLGVWYSESKSAWMVGYSANGRQYICRFKDKEFAVAVRELAERFYGYS